MVNRLCRFIFCALLPFGSAAAVPAYAQSAFPTKLVRIIVPFSPGGASDALPRLIAPLVSDIWRQPVIVENRPGAAGNIGMALGAKAPADGYTLTSAPVGNLAVNPHLYSKLPYDVFRDFTPVTACRIVGQRTGRAYIDSSEVGEGTDQFDEE